MVDFAPSMFYQITPMTVCVLDYPSFSIILAPHPHQYSG